MVAMTSRVVGTESRQRRSFSALSDPTKRRALKGISRSSLSVHVDEALGHVHG